MLYPCTHKCHSKIKLVLCIESNRFRHTHMHYAKADCHVLQYNTRAQHNEEGLQHQVYPVQALYTCVYINLMWERSFPRFDTPSHVKSGHTNIKWASTCIVWSTVYTLHIVYILTQISQQNSNQHYAWNPIGLDTPTYMQRPTNMYTCTTNLFSCTNICRACYSNTHRPIHCVHRSFRMHAITYTFMYTQHLSSF